MIATFAVLGVALVALVLALSRERQQSVRAACAARERHGDMVVRLLDRFEVERGEWRDERQLLLTRIQDPTAGVASSLAYLPAPGDMDMDVER